MVEIEPTVEEHYIDKNHDHEVLSKLQEMRKNGVLIDLYPVVDGVEFQAHSSVLASCSDYFLAMCDSHLISKDRRVHIKDINAATFEQLLDFMYTGSIKISPENVEDLLRGSSMLLLEKMKKKCSSYLLTLLNEFNCLGILSIADELSCEDLANKAFKYTQEKYSDVSQNPDFLQLPFHLVLKLISSDATAVATEDIIYFSIMNWVSFRKERWQCLPELFLNIRLRFVSGKVFVSDIVQNEMLMSHLDCQNRLREATTLRGDFPKSQRRLSFTFGPENEWLKPRLCMSDIKVVVAVGGVNALIHNSETNEWVQLSPVITRHCPGMGVLDNDLIIVGGSREWKRLGGGVRYDPKRNQWLNVVPMNQNRSNLQLATLDGYLYAIGGYNGETPLR